MRSPMWTGNTCKTKTKSGSAQQGLRLAGYGNIWLTFMMPVNMYAWSKKGRDWKWVALKRSPGEWDSSPSTSWKNWRSDWKKRLRTVFTKHPAFLIMDYYIHPSTYVDENCRIGAGTRIWHFVISWAVPSSAKTVTSGRMWWWRPMWCLAIMCVYRITWVYMKAWSAKMTFSWVCGADQCHQPESAISRKTRIPANPDTKGATIGANATIVCGNEIGRYAFIGAGAVVTKPVPDYALITGNPGRQAGWMSEAGHKLHFDSTHWGPYAPKPIRNTASVAMKWQDYLTMPGWSPVRTPASSIVKAP